MGKSAIPPISAFRSSAGGWNNFIGRLMGCPPGAPDRGLGGKIELEDIALLTGRFPTSPGSTLGAPVDDGPFPGNYGGGDISDQP
jgi:hypothetical protein